MKKLFLLWLSTSLFATGFAQNPTYPHALRFSVSQTTIDRKALWKKPALHVEATYARTLKNKRTVAELGLGYLALSKRQQYANFPFYYEGDQARRVSVTARLLHDFLKSPVHSFRVGGGLSGWYQRDNRGTDLTVWMNPTRSEVTSVSFRRLPNHRASFGYVVTVEYNYSITSRVVVGAKAEHLGAIVYPYQSAIPTGFNQIGLSAGYRF